VGQQRDRRREYMLPHEKGVVRWVGGEVAMESAALLRIYLELQK